MSNAFSNKNMRFSDFSVITLSFLWRVRLAIVAQALGTSYDCALRSVPGKYSNCNALLLQYAVGMSQKTHN